MSELKTYSRELKLREEKMDYKRSKVNSSGTAAAFARNFYHDDITIYESFFLILLNNANNTIGHVKISQGGVTATLIDVKILCKYVVETLAPAVILVHNHPSGKLLPSTADKDITRKIQNALKYLDSKVLDHIILTENSYYSFADEGIM